MDRNDFDQAVERVREHFGWQLVPYPGDRPSFIDQIHARSVVVCIAGDTRDGLLDIEDVLERAKESRQHWDGLALLAQWHLHRPETFGQLPRPLSVWLAELLGAMMRGEKPVRPSRSRGRPKQTARDGVLVDAINWVVRTTDLPAERPKREGPTECCAEGGSACDVVGFAVTTVTYGHVRRIWEIASKK